MSFARESQSAAREFAEREVAPSVASRDRTSSWYDELFRRMGESGLLGAAISPEYGGGGRSAVDVNELLSGFGEGGGDAGLALAWTTHAFGCAMPILRFGVEEQRELILPKLARGEWIGAFAHEEPGADPVGIQTRADRSRNGWVLQGKKAWVINGPVAQVFVVTALTDSNRKGASTFIVERNTPGLHVGARIETHGMRTAMFSEITLEGCEVRHENLLGAEACRSIRRAFRGHALAPWIGLLRALVQERVARAKERALFGRPAAASQSIRAVLADMRLRSELCRRVSERAARWLDQESPELDRDIAAASLFLSDAIVQTTRDALRIYGGRAGEMDRLSERLYRDATLVGLACGDPEVLRAVVARSLLGMDGDGRQ